MAGQNTETDNLEKALLERANKLAAEYLQRAEQQRDDIHREMHEKLHLNEEREVLTAKAMGERTYQQRVQATELQLQARLDHLRWQLVQQILDELLQALQKLAKDEKQYLPILKRLLQDAANAIPADSLVIELNQRDQQRWQKKWQKLVSEWLPDITVSLAEQPCDCSGGVRVHDSENRIRVDNSFEGRINMFRDQLEQTIMEQLFSKTMTTGELLHG